MAEIRGGGTLWLLFRSSALELWRNPLGLLLLLVIPAIFIGMTLWTAGDLEIPLKIFFGGETVYLALTQEQIALVFVSAAVSGFLAAYFALVLFHNDFGYFRFCAFMGLAPGVFTIARFGAFLSVTSALAAATTFGLTLIVDMQQPLGVFAGFLLVTVIYGAYGGIVGVASRSFMAALLLVFLLADLDAAWLQNPVYYSAAQQSEVIRWLPAHYPTQIVFSAAFTARSNPDAIAGALTWAAVMIVLLLLAVHLRMRGAIDALGGSGRFDQ